MGFVEVKFFQMPLLRTKSKSPPPSRMIPLRPLSDLSTDLGLLSPAQFPPETASALSQVNPSPGFKNVFSDPLIAHSRDNEDVNEENVIEGSSSSWRTFPLKRSAKGNRRSSRTPKRLSAKVARVVLPVPSVVTSSTSPVLSESSDSSELPTYHQVESHLPSSVPASAEMIPSSSIHSLSSDPALAEDTPPFVSSLTSEQRAYIIHLSRLSRTHTMSPEQLLAVSEKASNEIRHFELCNLAYSAITISATPDPLLVNQRTSRIV